MRKVVDLKVENGVSLLEVEAAGDFLRASLSTGETVLTRKLVLANGRDGSGGFRWPSLPSFNPEDPARAGRVFHTLEEIDFTGLKGKRLRHPGRARDGDRQCLHGAGSRRRQRRSVMRGDRTCPRSTSRRACPSPVSSAARACSNDDLRWKIYTYMLAAGSPPPHESVSCARRSLPGFAFRFAEPWLDLIADKRRRHREDGTKATERFDAVLLGTGFDIDLSAASRNWASFAANATLWGDRRTPEDARCQRRGGPAIPISVRVSS